VHGGVAHLKDLHTKLHVLRGDCRCVEELSEKTAAGIPVLERNIETLGEVFRKNIDFDPKPGQRQRRILLSELPVVPHVQTTWRRAETKLDHPRVGLSQRNRGTTLAFRRSRSGLDLDGQLSCFGDFMREVEGDTARKIGVPNPCDQCFQLGSEHTMQPLPQPPATPTP
jgi:hypothetical protein